MHRADNVGASLVVARDDEKEICFMDGRFKGYPQGDTPTGVQKVYL